MFEKCLELTPNAKSQIAWAQSTLWRLKKIHVSVYHFQSAENQRKERTLEDIGKTNGHHIYRRKGTRITLNFYWILTESKRERSGLFKGKC